MSEAFDNFSIDIELQVRLMNLAMGEASDFERDQLQSMMEQQPELAAYYREIEHLHGLLCEVGTGDSAIDTDSTASEGGWQLPADRRAKLLSVLENEKPKPSDQVTLASRNGSQSWLSTPRSSAARLKTIGSVIAFASVGSLLAGLLLLPAVQSSREFARRHQANRSRLEEEWLDLSIKPPSIDSDQASSNSPPMQPSSGSAHHSNFDTFEDIATQGLPSAPRDDGISKWSITQNEVQLRQKSEGWESKPAKTPPAPTEIAADLNSHRFPSVPIEDLRVRDLSGMVDSPKLDGYLKDGSSSGYYMDREGVSPEVGLPGITKTESSSSVAGIDVKPSRVEDSNGEMLLGGIQAIREKGKANLLDNSGQKEDELQAELMMTVTPKIIIAEGEELVLEKKESSTSSADGEGSKKSVGPWSKENATSNGLSPSLGLEVDKDRYFLIPNPIALGDSIPAPKGESAPEGNSDLADSPSKSSSEGKHTRMYDSERIQFDFASGVENEKQRSDLALGRGVEGRWNDTQAKNGRESMGKTTTPVPSAEIQSRLRKGLDLERKPIKAHPSVSLDEQDATTESISTFSLHVSDVSFKLAQTALGQGEWPDASKIRIEEFVNAMDYHDPLPSNQEKVACRVEQAMHPFLMQRNLLRVSMRTAATGRSQQTPLRLTLLLDNSGSMERPDRRQAVIRAFQTLTEQLTPSDQITLISFANRPRLLADRVPGNEGSKLLQSIENLPSEGGTNIEAALLLAQEKAAEQHLVGAQNRVVLMTDGAVNLGNADPQALAKMVTQMRDNGIAFDAAGIGALDLNDAVLEALTRQGDGRYYLLDSAENAGERFSAQIAGALRPSAQNVKVQIEFNPERVGRYRLLGFEKHRLQKEDFRNDQVDAAEMGAAEAGVALYQFESKPNGRGDIGSVSVRFRDLSTGEMVERRWPILFESNIPRLEQAEASMQLATTAALFAAKLGGGALAESVELNPLRDLLMKLPEPFAIQLRVQQMRTMIEQANSISR